MSSFAEEENTYEGLKVTSLEAAGGPNVN